MIPYYEDEYATLYCGECLEVMSELDTTFDACITDPPYGLPKDSKNSRGKLKNRVFNAGRIESWDTAPTEDYFAMIFQKSHQQIIWGGNYFNLPPCRCFVVWDKCQPWENFSKCEYAWTSYNAPAKLFKLDTRSFKKIHPTQKPLPLIQYCIEKLCKGADSIIDPFAGSGTIGVAAKLLNRKCTMIEKEEKYCAMAAKRLSETQAPTSDEKVMGKTPFEIDFPLFA